MGTVYNASNTTDDELEKLYEYISRKEKRLDEAGFGDFAKAAAGKAVSGGAKLFDLLQRGQYVSATAAEDLVRGRLPTAEELKDALTGKTKKSYYDVLGAVGMPKGKLRSVLGFGLDIGLDPLTYIPVGGLLAKGASRGVKAGTKLPGIVGKGFTKADDIAKLISRARKVAPYADKGMSDFMSLKVGLTGRYEDDLARHIYESSGKPMIEALQKGIKEGIKGDEIARAIEDPEYMKFLPDNVIDNVIKPIKKYLKETGEEKLEMGTVKGLIGKLEEENITHQMPLFSLKTLDKKKMGEDIFGNLLTPRAVDEMGYLPHFVTDEFKKIVQGLNGTPDEQMNIIRGLIPKNLPRIEKPRNYFQFADAMNNWAMKKYGVKMFEDDIYEIMPKYIAGHVRNKSLWEFSDEIKKLTNKNGKKLINKTEDFFSPSTKKINLPPNKVELKMWPFKGMVADKEVAEELNKVIGVLNSDEAMGAFAKAITGITDIFKKAVTVYSPNFARFNLNNLIGATFGNFLQRGPKVFTKAPMAYKLTRNPDIPLMLVDKFGAGNLVKLIKGKNKVLNKMGDFSSNIETFVRLNLALDLFKEGKSWDEIARTITKVHGNYSPEFYNQLERNVLSNVFPFYKWMRINIPFQLEKMAMNTGRYAVLPKFQSAITRGVDTSKMPDWIKDKTIVGKPEELPGGKLGVRTVNLPTQDLTNLFPSEEKGKGFLAGLFSQTNPLIKVPAELGFNKELYFDRQIRDKTLPREMQKAKAYPMANWPILKQLLGTQEVEYAPKKGAKKEKRLEADAKKLYLIRQVPVLSSLYYSSNRYKKEMEGMDDKTLMKLAAMVLAMESPVRRDIYDPNQEEYWQEKGRSAKLQNIINYLLKRGKIEYAK